jgi:hypothetical protein
MEKGSSTGEEMGRGPSIVRQQRASAGHGRWAATDEVEQGARGEGDGYGDVEYLQHVVQFL